jgi:hypothetical protein
MEIGSFTSLVIINKKKVNMYIEHAINKLKLTVNKPTIKPKRPSTDPKISTTNTFTNNSGFCASAKAALDPVTPTDKPQSKLQIPTVKPPQKIA